MLTRACQNILVLVTLLSIGCTQVVTVYWSKPGAGTAELLEDKEECQSLQRAAGLNEDRIEQCLEAQGWSPVRQEVETVAPETEIEEETESDLDHME